MSKVHVTRPTIFWGYFWLGVQRRGKSEDKNEAEQTGSLMHCKFGPAQWNETWTWSVQSKLACCFQWTIYFLNIYIWKYWYKFRPLLPASVVIPVYPACACYCKTFDCVVQYIHERKTVDDSYYLTDNCKLEYKDITGCCYWSIYQFTVRWSTQPMVQ